MPTSILLTLLAAPLLPQGGAAEAPVLFPQGLTPGALDALADGLILDEPGDGRTWARGATYKASFGPEGLVYRPFLGPDAPRSYPLALDLAAARVGGEPLVLAPRERSRDGRVVHLDRGALRETYHLAERSVEQTFVFDALPARGELVLELDVTTELAPRPEGEGLRFDCEHGTVRYGAATAVDAHGRRLALEQRLVGDTLRIVVPGDFVAAAALPLTVDPVLTTFSVSTDPRRQLAVDVAYEGGAATYQIVVSQLESTFDQDVLSFLYNASLDILFPPTSVDITSTSWSEPANASAFGPGKFLCAAITGNTIGSRRARGRILEAATGSTTAQFDISGLGAEALDVGGKGNGVNSVYDFMVVWQEADGLNNDFDIVAQAVDDDGTLTGGRIVIDGDVGDLDRKPAISKSSGRPGTVNADNEYMVVWEREISPTDHNIRCQVMEYTGSLTGHSQFSGYTFSDALDPDVSTWSELWFDGPGNRSWVLVFERRTGSDYDIFAVVARDGDADNARNLNDMQDLDLQLDHRDPAIAFDSQDYLVVYQTERAGGERTVELTALNAIPDGAEARTGLCLRRETLGSFAAGAARIGLASHWDGGGPNTALEPGDALAVFTSRTGATDDEDVAGAIVAEVSQLVSASQYCAAALHSGGDRAWMRAFAWGAASSTRLECLHMPPQQFGIFIVSRNDGFVAQAGGSQGNLCVQGAIGRIVGPGQILNTGPTGAMALLLDTTAIPLPTGAVAAQSGETWYYQAWFRDAGGTSNFSNGVRITYE